MKVGNIPRSERDALVDLSSGTVFFFEEHLYMKTDMMYVNYTSVPSVSIPIFATRLSDGVLVCFEGDTVEAGEQAYVEIHDGIYVARKPLNDAIPDLGSWEEITGEGMPW